jgi:Ca2+-binding EF-hand superfamily protein
MQKKTKIILAIAAAGLLGTAGVMGAANAEQGWAKHHRGGEHGMGMGGHMDGSMGIGRRHGRHKMMKHFAKRYDTNKDGKISQEEIDTNRTERLGKNDANGDGKLSLQEFEGLWMETYHKMMVRSFQGFDSNGDAQVTLDEYKEPLANIVERRDRNGDGVLSKEDRPRRGKRHHRKGEGRDKKKGEDNN